MCKHVMQRQAAIPLDPEETVQARDSECLRYQEKCDTSFRLVYLSTVHKNGGEPPGPRPLGRTHPM